MPREHDTTDAEQYRRRLYEVLGDGTLSREDTIVAALDVGRQYLGVENGHVTRIDQSAEEQVILFSTDGGSGFVPEGETTALSSTYCRTTIERDSPVAMSDVPSEPGWEARYREHGLACYMAVELTVGDETFGTLCFVDREVRERSFTEMERSFAELLARSVERELAAERYESRLDERREELARRERRLERSERKYESLVETAPDAIVLADEETGELVEVNAAMAELTGYEESELVGRRGQRMLVAGRGEVADAGGVEPSTVVSLVEADGPVDRLSDGRPLRIRRRDGAPVPVEVSANRVELDGERYVQAAVRDVRERRERERELRLKGRAIEEAQVGVTIAAAGEEANPLEYVNPEFCRLTGYDRDEVIGRDCRLLQGERTGEGPVAAMAMAIRDEEPVQEELLNYRADGAPFWNQVTVTPVRDRQGEVTHFVGFQQDVTERKRRETLVSVLNRVLRHNLRNDMTVVRGHANLLMDRECGDVADSAATISETADELVALSEKARTLEQVAEVPRELDRTDPCEVATTVADRVRDDYPSADVTVELEDSVPPVVATGRLERALLEILENAAAHAGEAPSVRLSVGYAESDDRVSIRIEDDGPGLASNERAVLDGRSETPLEHGTGLGLWLANWIVTGLGGELEVADTEARGTTVTVLLRTVTTRVGETEAPTPSAIGLDD